MDDVVDDGEIGSRGIDAMFQVALFVVRPQAVAGDEVPFDQHMMAVAQDALVRVVVEVIAAQHDVMGVVELDPVPAVADFEPLNSDPAGCPLGGGFCQPFSDCSSIRPGPSPSTTGRSP